MARNKVMAGGEITREQNDALESLCVEKGTSKNQLIGNLIVDYLEGRLVGIELEAIKEREALKRVIKYCVKNSLHFTNSELSKIAYPDEEN